MPTIWRTGSEGQVGRGRFGCIRRAAVDGASLNVYINAASMDDPARALRVREEASAIASTTRERCDELFDFVVKEVS